MSTPLTPGSGTEPASNPGTGEKDSASAAKKTRKCGICCKRLSNTGSKPLCKECTASVIKSESSSLIEDIRKVVKEEVQLALTTREPTPPKVPPTQDARSVKSLILDSDSEGLAVSDSESVQKHPASSDEEGEYKRFLFNPEDIDELIRAIRATIQMEMPKTPRSTQQEIFGGLGERKKAVFPVPDSVQKLIRSEWEKPDKGSFIPRGIKRRYPFSQEDCTDWETIPKVDAPVAKVAKHTALPFEDSAQLKDPLDRKAESLLRKTWETTAALLKPGVASTCVARTLNLWLDQLEIHLVNKTPRDQILESLPLLKMATSFLADAAAESVKLSARTAVLSNTARRALWLKAWSGDITSKNKLIALPFHGQYVFGEDLDKILDNATNKKRGFPEERYKQKRQPFRDRFFQPENKKDKGKTGRWSYAKGGRGRSFLFNPNRAEASSSNNKQ
ncbi:lamina-associated polypeptide 2, isoforms alpha/zeta-like isoform X2 [Bufo bufo]|uniref:lamina-associated polypeptide 2, isoforms alpha/zeta-like n=1 Tax=Bufo bufo TaxID=8384 RepID=UPI001ABEA6CC|nr:lamina-associated polypeptide 2, isoforms alpha/zeta-like [Bufo bufo]XP_040269319.1 lamina-associated polypeptide 2, isoforms alpha/zeta-like [Bufo bufo]XP_040272098.1 lamina-associated polypeptide 2, isoforms alpha/zeta-like [Bufo bufo]XP_040273737.1 lamina-associated polypeptide 2, isoforms alpha/zeta-like [Bufo bufo]XP_040273810.1 lamina-associated polypeptide 2, isoforms alpha/zeta-like [Bufo bufo]XP_040276962.1 lamina-associated polypeptide 2, isoforms alpha/zeta-like [Bufo bufo]XP_04